MRGDGVTAGVAAILWCRIDGCHDHAKGRRAIVRERNDKYVRVLAAKDKRIFDDHAMACALSGFVWQRVTHVHEYDLPWRERHALVRF